MVKSEENAKYKILNFHVIRDKEKWIIMQHFGYTIAVWIYIY